MGRLTLCSTTRDRRPGISAEAMQDLADRHLRKERKRSPEQGERRGKADWEGGGLSRVGGSDILSGEATGPIHN